MHAKTLNNLQLMPNLTMDVIINRGLMLDNKVLITLLLIYIYTICVKNFFYPWMSS